MLYTNADQFLCKRDELLMEIAGAEPGIVLITEVIPKAQIQPIESARLMLPGYQMYANFNPSNSNLGTSGL